MPSKTNDPNPVNFGQTPQNSSDDVSNDNTFKNASSETQHPFSTPTTNSPQTNGFQNSDTTKSSILTPTSDPSPAVLPVTSTVISDTEPTKVNPNLQDFVITSPHTPQKYGGKKVIATIFGLVVLVTSIITGVYFVRNQQLMVGQAWNCSLYVFGVSREGNVNVRNSSGHNEPAQQAQVYINGGLVTTLNVPALSVGSSADIGSVSTPGALGFSWRVVGTLDCQNDGSYSPEATPTLTPVPTTTPTIPPSSTPTLPPASTPTIVNTPTLEPTLPPEITARCNEVVAYDANWNMLSSSQLAALVSRDVVRFAVSGTTTGGTFDKARFSINGVQQAEVTTQKPGSSEFYQEYTIPDGTINFSVSAQIYHSSLGWL
jgi:hypothetical protein